MCTERQCVTGSGGASVRSRDSWQTFPAFSTSITHCDPSSVTCTAGIALRPGIAATASVIKQMHIAMFRHFHVQVYSTTDRAKPDMS